ncbi:conserved hypothetical protein [Pseudomonas sp. 8Z]|uniref:hypothetical protein n=1 Tax=Pseudomonas sp. 8Z TaxID=2653166 RepID=UPI0012F16495|nr:hypothetical protein [Pseudomonas sp. 8Z]VXC68804.1 conserved hypothetical protein [Pseudomonas sp. 8Z]
MANKTPEEMVALYMEAEAEILEGKTITFMGRQIGHENLKEIRAGRQEWERRIRTRTNGGSLFSLASFTQ